MTKKTVGIVGVGLMGHGIATNILKNGWPLAFLKHTGNQPTEILLANGAVAYDSAAALATATDVIIICVTGSPQVESILTGKDGILAGVKKHSIVIDCSTSIPASTKKLATLVQDAGAGFLDAPMTRTPKEAAEGKLNLIVGGERDLFDDQLPLLQSFAENITYAGGVGAGHTMKLLHNYVSLGFTTVLAEAAATSALAGLDPNILHAVLASGGGASVVLDRMAPFITDQDPSGLQFTISNSAKDLSYYTQMCEDYNANKTVADAISSVLSEQVASGNGENFIPHLTGYLSKPNRS